MAFFYTGFPQGPPFSDLKGISLDWQHGNGEEKCKYEGSLSANVHYLSVVCIAAGGCRVHCAVAWVA